MTMICGNGGEFISVSGSKFIIRQQSLGPGPIDLGT